MTEDTPTPSTADAEGDEATTELAVLESEVREGLRQVVDPEIGLDVVTLGLIRGLDVTDDALDVQMIFTTPFCPYGGVLLQQVKDTATMVAGREVTVTLLDEMWSPDMMEGGDWSEWGLF